jgi:predicted DNA-binding transcriptional regulator AlpA
MCKELSVTIPTDQKPTKTKLAAALSKQFRHEVTFVHARPTPADMADVALADINDLRALTRMSASWIHDAVRKGEFPAPAIRESRCTRWRLADIRSYLAERIQRAAADTDAASRLTARAKHASDAARGKRAARQITEAE